MDIVIEATIGLNPHCIATTYPWLIEAVQCHGTRYIITVIPGLNVNAGDDCIHAAAALIQLLSLRSPLAPPTPCPKERALFGASNKSQNGDVARSLSRSPEAHKGRCFSIQRIPINAPVFPFGPTGRARARPLDTRDQPVHI